MPNSNSIAQAVDDAVRSLEIKRNSIWILLSDASKCMAAADAILKTLHPKLFHVACVAYLLHNCAIKVKSHIKDVDQLIVKVNLAIVTNKIRQAKFATIGWPPQPVVTRWESWLMLPYIMQRICLK